MVWIVFIVKIPEKKGAAVKQQTCWVDTRSYDIGEAEIPWAPECSSERFQGAMVCHLATGYCRQIMWRFPFQKTSEQQSQMIQFDVFHMCSWIERDKYRKMPNFQRFTWLPRLVIEETIWKAVPEHYRRLDRCLKRVGVEGLPLDASILKVSSWMGGALPQGTGSLGELGSLAEKVQGCLGHDEANKHAGVIWGFLK